MTVPQQVRLGSPPDGQLVGKFCATAGTVRIDNYLVSVKWVRPADSAASSTLRAKWTTYECRKKGDMEIGDSEIADLAVCTV